MICNGQPIDSGPTDVSSTSAYLADRLNDRPANITSASSYFAIVRSLETREEAQRQLNALMTRFPSIQFSIYPPYQNDKPWIIVIASYTDLERANKALDLARWLGIGQDAHVWQLPQPFNVPEGWLPEDIHHVVLSCLRHGAQTIMDMYTCSGSVLTPLLLQACIKNGVCELNLTAISAAQYLAGQNLSWNTPLIVQAAMPDMTEVKTCLADHAKDEKRTSTVLLKLPPERPQHPVAKVPMTWHLPPACYRLLG
jgi:hypothetical protein